MEWKDFITILIAVLSSAGAFSLIQFLIQRKDKKSDMQTKILNKLGEIETKFDERDARIARENILRFDDELIAGVHHSREYFRVILEDDVDNYEKYCSEHANFKNSFTAEAVAHIRNVYKDLVSSGKFKAS